MNVNKLELIPNQEKLGEAFGFNDKEVDEYTRKHIRPLIDVRTINIATTIAEIFNNPKEPFAMKCLGLYFLGRMCEKRESGGFSVLGGTDKMPKELKRMIKDLLEDLDE